MMSGQPAARIGDTITCAVPQATPAALPHAPPPGLPIMPPGTPTVLIGGQPAARMGDQSMCVAPAPTPNPIVKGAFPVPIGNSPAARLTDQGTHPGSVIMPPCCPTVLIGLSGTAGNPRVGTAMCNAAAGGRTSNTTQQTYNNCGVESSRQVINQANGTAVSENQLLQSAINQGLANGTPGSPPVFANGGTNAAGRQQILANSGVASTVQSSNLNNLGLAMSRGQGTIANLDAAPLWGGTTPPGSLHAVTVTGVQYDDAGNVTNVIINDTGTGQCGQVVPVATWNAAVGAHPSPALNVTNTPIL
jgi:uncharacterized Zn-binding protein involved in type VI secretion